MLPSKIILSALLPLISLATIQHQRYLSCFALTAPPAAVTSAFSCCAKPTSSCTRWINMRHPLASRSRHRSSLSTSTQARYPDIKTNPSRLSSSSASTAWLTAGVSDLVGSAAFNSQRSSTGIVAMTASAGGVSSRASHSAGMSGARSVNWPLWYVLPIAPYQKRKTLMKEIVPGKVSSSSVVVHRERRCYFRALFPEGTPPQLTTLTDVTALTW